MSIFMRPISKIESRQIFYISCLMEPMLECFMPIGLRNWCSKSCFNYKNTIMSIYMLVYLDYDVNLVTSYLISLVVISIRNQFLIRLIGEFQVKTIFS